jgi:opacity protein-like surface antigen
VTTRILGVLSILLFMTLVVGAPSPAVAGPGGWDVSFVGGLGLPTGDFKDSLDAKSGPQAGIDICYHLNEKFAAGVDASWNRNKHEGEGEVEDLGGGQTLTSNKDRYTAIQYGVHGKYMISSSGSIKPYVMLGLGFYNLKEDYEYTYDDGVNPPTVFTDEDDVSNGFFEQPGSRFGYKFGLGATYMTSPKIGLGLSADYNSVSMDKDKFGVSSVPYISLRGRITYHIMPK